MGEVGWGRDGAGGRVPWVMFAVGYRGSVGGDDVGCDKSLDVELLLLLPLFPLSDLLLLDLEDVDLLDLWDLLDVDAADDDEADHDVADHDDELCRCCSL